MSLLLPALLGVQEGGPPRQTCSNNLRQIGLSIKQYAFDGNRAFPPEFSILYPDYIDRVRLFCCPSSRSEWERFRQVGEAWPGRTSYVYVAGLCEKGPAECVLAYCRPGNHGEDGVNVLFLDTHVEWCAFEEFEQHLARTRAHAAESGREIRLVGE